MIPIEDTDTPIRAGMVCKGCGKRKEEGSLLCWDCYKRHPVDPFKFSDLSIEAWLAKYSTQ